MKLDPRRERLLRRTFIDYRQTSEFIRDPLIIERAHHVYYWDVEGKRYFDAIGGIFVTCLGHVAPRVLQALARPLEMMTVAPPLHAIPDVTLDLFDDVGSGTPGDLE